MFGSSTVLAFPSPAPAPSSTPDSLKPQRAGPPEPSGDADGGASGEGVVGPDEARHDILQHDVQANRQHRPGGAEAVPAGGDDGPDGEIGQIVGKFNLDGCLAPADGYACLEEGHGLEVLADGRTVEEVADELIGAVAAGEPR